MAPLAHRLLALAPLLPIHDGLHERIARVDARIAEEGPAAFLYVERAELLRRHGDFQEALDDLNRARSLDSGSIDAALSLAHVYVGLERPRDARTSLESVLEARPHDPDALLLAGEVLAAAGELEAALGRYQTALTCLDAPRPAHFLAHAKTIRRLDARAKRGPAGALNALDHGIDRLGQVPALVLAAIDYEVERGAFDAALARLEQLSARASRKEHWIARRAQILERAGRRAEALEAWRRAARALAQLPSRHRNSAHSRELADRIEERTAALTPKHR